MKQLSFDANDKGDFLVLMLMTKAYTIKLDSQINNKEMTHVHKIHNRIHHRKNPR